MSENREEQRNAERAEFWHSIQVPFDENWQENGTEFVNPVAVADMFAEATAKSALLAQQAEDLSEKAANIEYEKGRIEREINKIRRVTFADNYSKLTKSAGSEIQDAFVLSMATPEDKQRLVELEDKRDVLEDKLTLITARLNKLKYRMKVLEKNLEWAKNWLDHEKLQMRIHMNGRN